MQRIKIDFDNPGLPKWLYVMENDAQSRFFEAELYQGGKAYSAPSGATYSIMYHGFGPQNEGWYDTINDGAGKRAACTVSGNVVTCELARQALRVPGHMTVILCVTDPTGYMLKGWPITANVRNDDYNDGEEVEMYFNLSGNVSNSIDQLEKAMAEAEQAKKDIETKAAEALASIPEDYTELDSNVKQIKEDLVNQENKLEPIVKSNQDLKDVFYICDVYGNIICKVDKDGVHSTGFDGKNLALNDVISTYEDSFYISDSNGNVIFMADKDGVRGLNMGTSSDISSPFKGMKLLTIGDSLSAHNNWQKWLVEWLGVTFDNDENINGKDGHKPMAKGGTAIAPTSEDSIYMRALDAKYYVDNTKGTVIIIYAGQNDTVTLGTIDDTPYTDKTVTTASKLTFYSSYMGMVENILADIPSARIYLMTQMPVRLEIGMTGTAEPYVGVVRFPDMESVLKYEASRYKKVEAIRAISKKYSLPCIDLWADSGINDYNSKYWYGAVGGTCGQVHPNNIGYKRMAEVAVAKMY